MALIGNPRFNLWQTGREPIVYGDPSYNAGWRNFDVQGGAITGPWAPTGVDFELPLGNVALPDPFTTEPIVPGDIGGPTNGEVVPVPVPQPVQPPGGGLLGPDPGADLRDLPGGGGPVGGVIGALPVGVTLAAARALLRAAMGGVTRVTRQHWESLPGWARTLLAAVGIGVGVDLAVGLPGVPGESFLLPSGGGDGEPHFGQHMTNGHLGVTIIGGWEANGVRFYRLSDGKLAVQNKHGRWKVWRPKKPIVLMPGGANNLKNLLRADALLNRQAKRIAAMLNRRAPRSRKGSKTTPSGAVIIQSDGKVVNS